MSKIHTFLSPLQLDDNELFANEAAPNFFCVCVRLFSLPPSPPSRSLLNCSASLTRVGGEEFGKEGSNGCCINGCCCLELTDLMPLPPPPSSICSIKKKTQDYILLPHSQIHVGTKKKCIHTEGPPSLLKMTRGSHDVSEEGKGAEIKLWLVLLSSCCPGYVATTSYLFDPPPSPPKKKSRAEKSS